MAKYTIEDSTLTGIADAIREKTGGTEAIAVTDMATQIAGIETGKTFPNGTEWTSTGISVSHTSLGKGRLCVAGGKYLAGYGTTVLYSTDGKAWQAQSLSKTVRTIAYGDGKWIIGTVSDSMLYSTDGLTWIDSGSPPYSFNAIEYHNGIWVGCDWDKGIYYSTNGIDWIISNATISGFSVLEFANGVWMACNNNGKGLYRSTDGKSWSVVSALSSAQSWVTVVHRNGLWQASGNGTCYSVDGVNWTTSNGGLMSSIEYGDGVWVAGRYHADGGMYYSTDGKSWSKANIQAPSGAGAWYVYYANGVFVASDGLVGCGLYYSTDGINWIQTNVTSGTLAGAQCSKGIWVAGAYGPGLIYSVGWEPS